MKQDDLSSASLVRVCHGFFRTIVSNVDWQPHSTTVKAREELGNSQRPSSTSHVDCNIKRLYNSSFGFAAIRL